MARYRLRFHLREVDLQKRVTSIGRDDGCEVTLDDPVVSRRHAQIVIDRDGATLVDLDSRNGVWVNGERVVGSRSLVPGDRLRIGAQDLVFATVARGSERRFRTTGVLTTCDACHATYAREALSCPTCGASPAIEPSVADRRPSRSSG